MPDLNYIPILIFVAIDPDFAHSIRIKVLDESLLISKIIPDPLAFGWELSDLTPSQKLEDMESTCKNKILTIKYSNMQSWKPNLIIKKKQVCICLGILI